MAQEIDAEQRAELELMVRQLEQENSALKEEYTQLKIAGQMPISVTGLTQVGPLLSTA